MNIFSTLTPVIYGLLVSIWSFILVFYLRRLRKLPSGGKLLYTLLTILALDAFRTLFESVYFGFWYTSLAGWLPASIHLLLTQPELVFIPKLVNLIAGIAVVAIVLYRWLPLEQIEIIEHENRYQLLFENSADAIYTYDPKTLVILDANEAASKLYGYEMDELLGMSCLKLSAEVDESKSGVSEVNKQGTVFVPERHHLKKDGSDLCVQLSIYSVKADEQEHMFTVCRDITERKHTEEALHKSEEKYRTLFETMSQGVVYQDADGKIISANASAERILGLTFDQMQGRSSVDPRWKSIQEDGSDLPGDIHPSMVALKTGQPVSNSIMGIFHPKEEESRWININAIPQFKPGQKKPYQVYTTFQDITKRKQVEEELVGTKFVLDTTTDAVYWMQQDGQFVDVNDAACKKLGYTRGELLAMHVNDMNPDYPADRWPATWELIKKEKSVNIEAHHKTKDGIVFPVEIQANYVQFGDKERICSYVRDITMRKQAENNLRESENRYRALVENSPICIHEIDLSGKIISMNRSGLDMLDLNNEADVCGLTYIDAVGADDRPIIEGLLRKALKGESSHFEFQGSNPERLVYYQSSFIPIKNKVGEVVRLMGMSEDITERKMVEKALQESEERVAALADASKEAIFFSEKGFCLDQNHAAERMFGYSREEAVGKMGTDWIIPEHHELVMQNMLAGFEGLYEVDALRKDGSTFHAEIRAGISRYMGRDVRVTALRDITRRKQAEQAQLVMKAQLHQAQKLEAIGTMVGGISHEFNNVLQSMFLYASLVQADLPKNEVLRSNFQHILDDGNRAGDLVKQILTFSRKAKVEMKPQPLHEMAMEVLVLERASLPANIEIKTAIDMNCGMVFCDKTQISQIIMNLCNNAQHAMEEKGGTLTVSLKQVQASMNNGDPETEALELKVSDTGQGIEAVDLEKIFDPFFTTKELGKGTGLGLSVIHGIVEMMEGQISVTSAIGKGTTFRILFPVTEAVQEEEVIKSSAAADVMSRSILLVDDEESIRSVTQIILTRKGFKVDSASDGTQALELFKANPGKYDLIVTDQSMPKMSGVELTKAIRDTKSDIPIILSTGQLGVADEKEFKDIGITTFIQKPWTAEELIQRIQELGN